MTISSVGKNKRRTAGSTEILQNKKEEELAMEGVGESALDVLSRAATMLQEQSPMHITNDEPKHQTSKQLPSSKWKRDRRSKPEYTRKPDPSKSNDTQPTINGQQQRDRESPTSRLEDVETSPTSNGHVDDSPLDMSVRQRGLPPSYSQAINDPSFRSSYKSSVVQEVRSSSSSSELVAPTPIAQAPACNVNGSGNVGNTRDELPSGISMCDPIIDEHFRRSLGKAYMTVFNNNNNSSQQQQASTTTTAAANSNRDNLASTNSSNRTSPIPTHPSSHTTTSSSKTNNQQTQAKSPCNSTEAISTVKNDNQQTVTARKVTIVNTATNITTVSDLMDGAGLSVDDHFAKALGDTWLKLNGKKDNANSENVGLKTTSNVSVVENGNANSMVTI